MTNSSALKHPPLISAAYLFYFFKLIKKRINLKVTQKKFYTYNVSHISFLLTKLSSICKHSHFNSQNISAITRYC